MANTQITSLQANPNDQNLLSNIQLQQLEAQLADPQGFPNVNQHRYFSVDRLLKNAVSLTYGVRNLMTGQPASVAGTVDFLVLAVQGGTGSSPNLIFLANRAFPGVVNKLPNTPTFTLNTQKNVNVSVTVKKIISPGTLQVNQTIVTDTSETSFPVVVNSYLSVPRQIAYGWGFK